MVDVIIRDTAGDGTIAACRVNPEQFKLLVFLENEGFIEYEKIEIADLTKNS